MVSTPAATPTVPSPHAPQSTGGPAPPAPSPRRLRRPRWINARVIAGILILVAAIVVGAKVIGSNTQTTPVWAAQRDLAAGTVLGPGDLASVEVNLGEAAAQYLTPSASAPEGMTVVQPLRAGELVAGSALARPGDGRVVAISVQPEAIPPGVEHGSTVDLYLTTGGDAAGRGGTTELIGRDLTVQSVTPPASGGLSGATSNRYQISVLLPAQDADTLVRRLPTGEPILVLVSGQGS